METKRRIRAMGQRGFTLVEVMIGLLIGLVGIIVIMQTFAVSEGYKRTATSGTDAQVNGSLALYLLEREIRLAGFGMNSLVPTGCTVVRIWNDKTGTGADMRMVPFEINPAGIPAGDPNTDVILIAYGTSDNFVTGVPANQVSNSSANFVVDQNRTAFHQGDLVIAVQPGAGPGGSTSCVLNELTGVPGTGGNCGSPPTGKSNELIHNTGQYKNPNANCQMVSPTYNNASGIKDANGNTVPALDSTSGGQLFDIGALPQIKIYAIRGGNLTVCDMLAQDCTNTANYAIMVNDVVSMRAVYGKDTDANGVVDSWDRNAITNSTEAMSVLAAAVEITSRSGVKEKPTAGPACDTTADAARPDRGQTADWYADVDNQPASLAAAQIDLSTVSADWQCYRYKLFQTSVPLRNMIWRP